MLRSHRIPRVLALLRGVALVALVMAACGSAPVLAQSYTPMPGTEKFFPMVGTETVIEFQYDSQRNAGGSTLRNFNIAAGHQTIVDFDPHWSFTNQITLQQLSTPFAGVSVLQNEGAFMEEAYLKYTNDIVTMKVGKFSQNFGRAWYLTPGVYGTNFVTDYQLAEKVGIELAYAFGLYQYGKHQISVSSFEADRSLFSQSAFYNRGHLGLADGGPTNTLAPSSVVASYDARMVPLPFGALSYQFSVASLGRGEGDTGQERRLGAGFNINVPINNGVRDTLAGKFNEIRFIGEAVRRTDADGVAGQTIDYYTGATEFVYDNWFYDLSATLRNTNNLGDVTRDRLVQATVGYNFPSDTTLSVGVGRENVNGVESTVVGARLTYTLTTCLKCKVLLKSGH